MSKKILYSLFITTFIISGISFVLPNTTPKVSAATIEHTCSIPRKKLSFNEVCQFPQFDPSAGTLNSINYTTAAKIDIEFSAENADLMIEQRAEINFNTIITVRQSVSQESEFTFDAGKDPYKTEPVPTLDDDQEYYEDGEIIIFTGSGNDTITFSDEVVKTENFEKTENFDNYIGTENIDLQINVRNVSYIFGENSDFNTGFVTHAQIETMSVVYNYDSTITVQDCSKANTVPYGEINGFDSSCIATADPDHLNNTNVDYYTITTLPDASCGTLFLQTDPNDETTRTAIGANDQITPDNLNQIVFVPTNGNAGCSTSFTYTATDETAGQTSESATVTLDTVEKPTPITNDCTVSNSSPYQEINTFGDNCMQTTNDFHSNNNDISHYTITTLPEDTCGILFLQTEADNPTSRQAISIDDQITPDNLNQIVFVPTNGNAGCSTSFTYTATDSDTGDSSTPSTVTINTVKEENNKKNSGSKFIDMNNSNNQTNQQEQNKSDTLQETNTQKEPQPVLSSGKGENYSDGIGGGLPRTGGLTDALSDEKITLFSFLTFSLVSFFGVITHTVVKQKKLEKEIKE